MHASRKLSAINARMAELIGISFATPLERHQHSQQQGAQRRSQKCDGCSP